MQVLKDEIKDRIFKAAIAEFYKNCYQKTTMKDIAEKARIPASLIYSYYKNKQTLFDDIVLPIVLQLPKILKQAEETSDPPFDEFINIEKQFLLDLFDKRLELIILIDKSAGTSQQDSKEKMIKMTEVHINTILEANSKIKYDALFAHILASNFVESFLEIVRHYKSREWAIEMLELIIRHYFLGINSL